MGDFVFLNEFKGTSANTVNFQTGYVISVVTTGPVTGVYTTTIVIKLPFANVGNNAYTPGMIQFLTNRSDPTKDCLRYYVGNPIKTSVPLDFNMDAGWVNFMPPLSNLSSSIADLPEAQYYLVGAVMILPFKDRLIAIGPVVQTS